MLQEPPLPPRGIRLLIKLARIGEFKDEYEEFFLIAYKEKYHREGADAARRWCYIYAAKTVFFAAIEWGKLALILYARIWGK